MATQGDLSVASNSPDVNERIYSFARRIVRLMKEVDGIKENEIKPLQQDIKEVVSEAKGNGFDAKIIRQVAKELFILETADQDDYEEAATMHKLYWKAIMSGLRKDGKYHPEGEDDGSEE